MQRDTEGSGLLVGPTRSVVAGERGLWSVERGRQGPHLGALQAANAPRLNRYNPASVPPWHPLR